MAASVYLDRKRKKRLEEGHPWIFANEIGRIEGEPVSGGLVNVYSHSGLYLATGYYNQASQIRVRVISYEPVEALTKEFFVERLVRCKELRERFLGDSTAYRAVYGEADFLPGLVVDRFGDVLVVQILTLGMDVQRDVLVEALTEVFRPAGIYERSDVPVRELEGMEQRTGLLYGECPGKVQIKENGLLIEVDIVQGQKTGYFFDQQANRALLAPLMKGWGRRSGIRLEEQEADGIKEMVPVNANGKAVTFPYWDGATVLECFSHTGSFTINALNFGAKKVTCLDISEHAIESAKRNVELNGFSDRVEFVVADAFEYLRMQAKGLEDRKERSHAADKKVDTSAKLAGGGRTWDVVILDPPAFAKTRGAVEGACRGYKDINLHGLKLVNEGGFLVTASCSFHVRPDLFLATIHEAAKDAGKILRLLEYRGAGKDHPQILGVEEGNYLKFAVFEVRSRK
jgi:23S rRNA (cytosine1962-C5)-methyltransferase